MLQPKILNAHIDIKLIQSYVSSIRNSALTWVAFFERDIWQASVYFLKVRIIYSHIAEFYTLIMYYNHIWHLINLHYRAIFLLYQNTINCNPIRVVALEQNTPKRKSAIAAKCNEAQKNNYNPVCMTVNNTLNRTHISLIWHPDFSIGCLH